MKNNKSRIKMENRDNRLPKKQKVIFTVLAIAVIFLGIFLLGSEGITGATIGVLQGGVEIEEGILDQVMGKGEVSIIVLLKNEPLKESKNSNNLEIKVNSKENMELRKEMIKEVQTQVLGKLNLKKKVIFEKEMKREFTTFISGEKSYDLELTAQYSNFNGFSGKVTKSGLRKLATDSQVKKIFLNRVLHPTLTTSIPQINADDVWNLSVGGLNIAGEAETICVIDTGIDTDHSAFTGRILDQYCYCSVSDYGSGGCCPDNTTEENSAEDGQGHGTHVTGIAAGNHSVYRGVAPEAGIVSIKVCNNEIISSCSTADVISAIDWCTENTTKYNISVISMSLGSGGPYNDYCNGDSVASAIDTAVGQNISVVISSGNDGYTNGISSPACVENATPVGAVNSADTIFYNRGTILDILAPGVSITAPYNDGGTITQSGTSMSAPHVSGSVILFKQYWRLAYNQTPTPQQIEDKFKITGKLIDDSINSGKNYSRLDIFKAVQPYINFTANSPDNATTIINDYILINITADVNLTRALLEWDYNNGTIVNLTMNQKNDTSFFSNITDLGTGNHTYLVYGNDSANTFGTSEIRMLTVDDTIPNITFFVPINNSYYNNAINLNISVVNLMLAYSNYSITNSSADQIQFNITNNLNQPDFNWTDLVNISNSTFSDGNYTLTVFANDSIGNSATSTINITVDKTNPLLFALNRTPDIIYNNDTVVFEANATDANLNTSRILLESNFSGSWVNYTMVLESEDRYNYTLSGTSNLSNQKTIGYIFHAYDLAGNLNTSNTFNFTVQNRNLTLVNITNPLNGSVLEIGNDTQFNATATDPDNDTLIYTWNFSDNTSLVTGQNPTHQFNSTGYFLVILNVSDGIDSSNLTNITIIVNDTLGPTINSITYDSEVHLQQDGNNQTITATTNDLSGISNMTLTFNNEIQSRACSNQGNTNWTCSWSWNGLSVGTNNFTLNMTDNFTTTNHNSSTITFLVTSCSDGTQNGDESGVDCGGSCTTVCSAGSSSSSSGGGGGGGGSSSNIICTLGAINCIDESRYTECLAEGTTNKWGDSKDVLIGQKCEFGEIVKVDESVAKKEESVEKETIEETIQKPVEKLELEIKKELTPVKASSNIQEKQSLAGRAFGFFTGSNSTTKQKVFLWAGLIVIITLIIVNIIMLKRKLSKRKIF